MMPRLFVAIRPPPAICDALLDMMEGIESARWQDETQLHLTLRFIGEVDHRTADDVAATLASVVFAPLEIRLAGFGTFARKRWLDSLWIGAEPITALVRLHDKLDHALIRVGLLAEGRAYRPHVTLARGRLSPPEVAAFIARHAAFQPPPFAVRTIELIESNLGKGGPHYMTITKVAVMGYSPDVAALP